MGSSLATATMPLFGAFIIENWGWRQAWVVMGSIVLLLTLPAVILVRRRPEDLGMHPDGLEPGVVPSRPPSEREQRRRQQLLAADVVWTRRQVLRTPAFWIMVFSWGLAGLAVTATNLHLIPYVLDLGYPLVIAAGAVSVRATAMLIGAPIWGFAVDRVPIHAAACGQFICKALSMLLFLVTPTPVGLVVALLMYGIGNAGSSVVQETIWGNYYGRISLGTVRGIVYPLQTFLAAFGPLVMGLLYDLSGSYNSSWAFLSLGFVAAAILILQSRPPRHPEGQIVGRRDDL
jgi:MFS family permease